MKTAILILLKHKSPEEAFDSDSSGTLKLGPRLKIAEAIGEQAKIDSVIVPSISITSKTASQSDLRQRMQKCIDEWSAKNLKTVVKLHYRDQSWPTEPSTLALWQAWDYCFRALGCDRVLYIDPVVTRDGMSEAEVDSWVKALAIALDSMADLIIWDYRPIPAPGRTTDGDCAFKVQIEAEIKQKLLRCYPQLADWDVFRNVSRVRSEFNLISRKLYLSMQAYPMFAYDAGLLALLVAWRQGLVVKTAQLGDVPEGKKYTEETRRMQIERVGFQLEMMGDKLAVEWQTQKRPPLSKGPFRAAYAIPTNIPLITRLERLYVGEIDTADPLYILRYPIDQRGEVNAWGGPHITLLDALTVRDVTEFARIMRDVCPECRPPVVAATHLSVWNRKSLVLHCESPGLEEIRRALIKATRQCIERLPLTDEEIQKARWWIHEHSPDPRLHLQQFQRALQRYFEVGTPPLPASRHFRLGYLVKSSKELDWANEDERPTRQRALDYFLSYGEPTWYGSTGGLHLTLASGLTPDQDVNQLKAKIEPSVLRDFPPSPICRIGIVTEDPDSQVEVSFFDWLTETPVRESRFGYKVESWADLNCNQP